MNSFPFSSENYLQEKLESGSSHQIHILLITHTVHSLDHSPVHCTSWGQPREQEQKLEEETGTTHLLC